MLMALSSVFNINADEQRVRFGVEVPSPMTKVIFCSPTSRIPGKQDLRIVSTLGQPEHLQIREEG
jgi:hypothetical protein